jgi:hypothetical protein
LFHFALINYFSIYKKIKPEESYYCIKTKNIRAMAYLHAPVVQDNTPAALARQALL